MKTKQTLVKTLALGVVIGVLIGFAVWNVNRVSAIKEVDKVQFGIVTLLPASQNARLNLVRVDGSIDDPNIRPCRVQIKFYDANGRTYGTPDTFNLRPGVAISRIVIPQGGTAIEGGFQFRAEVGIDPEDATRNRCTVVPTMEVFSKQTGGTLFMYPGLAEGFNPQPDPPGQN
ncbi:MAG: hypothetical protein H0W58_01935 [Acidobacteria bacterium]|jgi:hypothetical protein|nr:hypothetical protein [Acidobacteriota bacterium]